MADELGYHPETVRRWIKVGGFSAGRKMVAEARVIDDGWQARIHSMLRANPRLLGRVRCHWMRDRQLRRRTALTRERGGDGKGGP